MQQTPNIILINCDDLGWGDPTCYGHPRNQTPHLDRLAAEGVRFTDFYMASPVCSPSRGAMMTGCYPARIGFHSFEGRWVLFPGQPVGLSPEETTVAELLRAQGYATKLIGKWHCGDQAEFLPTRHGFDEYYGIPYSNDMGRQAGRRHLWPPLPLVRDEEVIEAQPDQASITQRYTEEAVRYLRAHAKGQGDGKPFFLYLAHMYVHLPLIVPERFAKVSKNGRYGAAVAAIDWSTGVLMAELTRLHIDENTLVVFTSDNGSRNDYGESNGPLRGVKGTTWEGGQRVPCIVRWPGTIPAGQTCREVATAMDFLPTFAGIAGADVPTDRIIDGKDILPLMTEERATSPHEAFYYHHQGRLEAVRSGDFKLHIRKRDDEILELYNLRDDIGEQNNLAADMPEKIAELERHVAACRADIGDDAVGEEGVNRRPIGTVAKGRPMTEYDPSYPYFIAEYDLDEAG